MMVAQLCCSPSELPPASGSLSTEPGQRPLPAERVRSRDRAPSPGHRTAEPWQTGLPHAAADGGQKPAKPLCQDAQRGQTISSEVHVKRSPRQSRNPQRDLPTPRVPAATEPTTRSRPPLLSTPSPSPPLPGRGGCTAALGLGPRPASRAAEGLGGPLGGRGCPQPDPPGDTVPTC